MNQWVQRNAKMVRTRRYVLRADPVVGSALPSNVAELDALLDAASGDDVLKNDRTTTVAKLQVANQTLILKRYNPRNQWHKIKRALRKSRARRCWEMSFAEAAQQAVKSAVLSAFEKLAAARISHGDMKATNLLWVDNELFFIDLDAAQQHSPWSLTWRKNHNKDKRRFLKNWQHHGDLLQLFSALEY